MMTGQKQTSLYRLLTFRALIAAMLLSLAFYFHFQPIPESQRQVLLSVTGAFIFFIILEFWLLRTRVGFPLKLGIQFFLDLVLVSGLVFATGGFDSPFTFLYGLIVVVAGSLANPLLIMTVGLVSCACYLGAVYLYAGLFTVLLTVDLTLQMLLQVSTLFLVTGVMAAMARRRRKLALAHSQARDLHRNLQELHARVMENLKEGILVLDGSLEILDINTAAQALLGSGNLTGKKLEDVMRLSPGMLNFISSDRGGVYHEELTDENHTWLVTIIRLHDEDPDSVWLLKITDVSQTHVLQRKLTEQNKMVALGHMTALLAHEIRNPLQSIAQAVDLMPVAGSAHDREVRSILKAEIRRLNRLVSDMLDYVSPLTPHRSRVDVDALLSSSIKQVDVDGKHEIHVDARLNELEVDIDHFRLVIDNLLRNALAASPVPGSIQVRLETCGGTEWKLTVCDQGGGVPEKILTRIFEPFVSGKTGGFGLGLATVSQVCLANDWQLEVENREGGACFHIAGKG